MDSDKKYIENIDYIYNNIDKFMENESFKNYIDNSEHIIQKYHEIFNTNDRNEVIAKYTMLTLYLLLNF
jgi:hypothetical protein